MNKYIDNLLSNQKQIYHISILNDFFDQVENKIY